MRKLRVFFAIALVAALLPLNAFARYEEGDIVQDPKHPNIKREMIEEMSQKWLVHITGKLPVTATLNGHDYVDLGIKVDGKLIMWAACDVGATKPEQAQPTAGAKWSIRRIWEAAVCRTAKKCTAQPSSATLSMTPRASIGAASGACLPCPSCICLSANARGNRRR